MFLIVKIYGLQGDEASYKFDISPFRSVIFCFTIEETKVDAQRIEEEACVSVTEKERGDRRSGDGSMDA